MQHNPSVGSDSSARRRFPGISPRAYEHPADRAALVALRSVPGFDLLLRRMLGLISDRNLRLVYLGSAAQVNERQFKTVHRLYQECLEVLDVNERPELFIAQDPFVTAGAVGVGKPFIVLNATQLISLEPDELRIVLAFELGHILSGHALCKTMLRILQQLSFLVAGIPVASWTLAAIMGALKEWDRKSEFSADRAALLVGQDPQASYRVLMKLAGGTQVGEMQVTELVRQAEEYETGGDFLNSVIKLLNLVDKSHPFPVLRLAELKRWVDSGEYQDILSGNYPRQDGDGTTSVFGELLNSARSYKERYEDSKAPLTNFLRDLGGSVSSAGRGVLGRFRREGPEES